MIGEVADMKFLMADFCQAQCRLGKWVPSMVNYVRNVKNKQATWNFVDPWIFSLVQRNY